MKASASEIAGFLEVRGYEWNFDGNRRIPNEQEVQEVLDKMALVVTAEGEGTVLAIGGLLFNSQPEGMEVYVYMGDYTNGE